MARRRYISTDISVDDRLARLIEEGGPKAALLYTWMIPHADDHGQIHANLRKLAMMVVPGVQSIITLSDIESSLLKMASLGLIHWSRADDLISFPPAAFYRYQTYIPPDRRKPESCADDAALPIEEVETPQSAAEQRESAQNAAYPSVTVSSSVSPSPSVSTRGDVGGADAPDNAEEIAEILVQAPWVNDDIDAIAANVRKAFKLVPDFSARDGPALAELFIGWRKYGKSPPANWYLAWLQWLRKEVRDEHQPRPNGATAPPSNGMGSVESDIARRGYSYNAVQRQAG